jgi:hypothetical protein
MTMTTIMGQPHNQDDQIGPGPVIKHVGLRQSFAIVALAVWGLLALAICGGSVVFVATLGSANGAPQEAAAGAIFSTIFIALYVLARCVEKITGAVERFRSKQACPQSRLE